MITAVLDTNVFIQTLIGTPRSASARTLRALDDGRFRLAFCPATIDELLDVLALPDMRYLTVSPTTRFSRSCIRFCLMR